MKIRINQIECRHSQGRYELIKWFANSHYGSEERLIAEGFVRVENPETKTWSMKRNNYSIHSSCFENAESCYTIATLYYDRSEGCCELKTVGARLLELNRIEREDFFAVYELAEERIQAAEYQKECDECEY